MSARTRAKDLLHHERTLDCVHCGLCLPACPTYELFGRETTGPRGRIYLFRGLAEGELEVDDAAVRDLDLCLVCRACEPVCPSGVRFGEMMEFVRSEVLERERPVRLRDRLRRFAVRDLLPYPRRLRLAAGFFSLLEATGLRSLAKRSWFSRVFAGLAAREQLLPELPPRSERAPMRRFWAPEGERRGRVALLEGCVMPLLLGRTNRATARVLAGQGFEVAVPEPVCCGALSLHFGAADAAREAARRTIEAFERLGEVDAVVVNSAGCGAAMREYARTFEGWADEDFVERALAFSSRVRDVHEFLVERGLRGELAPVEARVAYADACHLAHAQGIRDAPRQLLDAIPGVERVELERPDRCCGAAGLYNALFPEVSLSLLESRIEDLRRAGAQTLATGNPGCLIQWRAGVRRANLDVEVLHPVELLDRAMRGT